MGQVVDFRTDRVGSLGGTTLWNAISNTEAPGWVLETQGLHLLWLERLWIDLTVWEVPYLLLLRRRLREPICVAPNMREGVLRSPRKVRKVAGSYRGSRGPRET
jgi:hypothetical protein